MVLIVPTSRLLREYLIGKQVNALLWPSKSPDLNVIENV